MQQPTPGVQTEPDVKTGADAEEGGGEPERMWRKLVALRWDQKAALEQEAAGREDDPGNVSAVIRDAVDNYFRAPRGVPEGG